MNATRPGAGAGGIPQHFRDGLTAELEREMLRWVNVAPQGGQVVYSALGRLYGKTLPEGEARWLTKQTEHFEFFPSYSPDGREVGHDDIGSEEMDGAGGAIKEAEGVVAVGGLKEGVAVVF